MSIYCLITNLSDHNEFQQILVDICSDICSLRGQEHKHFHCDNYDCHMETLADE